MARPTKSPKRGQLTASVSAAAKARKKAFDAARSRIASLRGEGTKAWDALWEEVASVVHGDEPLYKAAYGSLAKFIEAELPGEDARSVARNVLVAVIFTPDDEKKHGITFLEEAALYVMTRSKAKEPPPAIDLDRLTIQFGTGAAVIRKKAADATIDELRKARRALRPGGDVKRSASPLEKAIRAALAKDKTLRAITVRVSGSDLAFGGVPATRIKAFAGSLAKAKLPL